MNRTEYKKLKLTLRSELLGFAKFDSRYYQCLKAFDLAEKIHSGFRKDGITPEFYHQLNMLAFSLSIHSMLDKPYYIYTTILLHDADEDYPYYVPEKFKDSCSTLNDYFSIEFADELDFITRMSKIKHTKNVNPDGSIEILSVKKDLNLYFSEIANCPICSVSKGIDRIHNISSMVGVFNNKKMFSYVSDVDELFLPMLKVARKNFLTQRPIYELIKSILCVNCDILSHFISKSEK